MPAAGDDGSAPGRFLLTGRAVPSVAPVHSGAGRVVTLRMRPLSLTERGLTRPTVRLAELLSGTRPDFEVRSDGGLADYLVAIVASFVYSNAAGGHVRHYGRVPYGAKVSSRPAPGNPSAGGVDSIDSVADDRPGVVGAGGEREAAERGVGKRGVAEGALPLAP